MEVYRLGVKFFASDSASVSLPDFIPIFHTWIQKQLIEDHLLIDVHNYSHIQGGPGILLVAHEGNFSTDMADTRLGLLYYRKQPLTGTAEDSLASILKPALQACGLLESEPSLGARLHFKTNELLIVSNDRLNAPNEEKTLADLRPVLSTVLGRILGRANFKLNQVSQNPKERFAVRVQTDESVGVKDLLSRIKAPLGLLTALFMASFR